MSDWQYATTQTFNSVSGAVDLSFVFSQPFLIIDLDSNQKKASWNKAGDILQVLDVELALGFYTRVEVADSFAYLGFAPTLLNFNLGDSYRLRFKPVPWLTQFTLTIYQGNIATAPNSYILGI